MGIVVSPACQQGIALTLGMPMTSLLVHAVYSGGLLCLCGQTVGKMAMGIRVIGPDGRTPGFFQAVLRETLGKWISTLVFFLGYLWTLWDVEQQTWHDKLAGTFVERA